VSPHTLTTAFDAAKRIELARADAAAGRMTAADCLDLAAELVKELNDEYTVDEGEKVEDLESDLRDAEERADEAEAELEKRRDKVLVLVRRMDAYEKKARRAGADTPADVVGEWADHLREAFEIEKGA
jgi:hypothetical protein